ncbi:hypothetical protein [Cohnella sp. AR92]|uniref:hypothetical protein n=1 Tax=Cohnella sp. AR92 TaxID=648716 RepID=UPI000F8F438E|nr:hypothetical protein [Cohnella sp. AR92]RUS45363.1 hypothetical protein ELR57_20905 [Cohnella sp. AR92]
MQRLARAHAFFRRTILVILILILIPHYVQRWTDDRDRGLDDTIKALQADGTVTAIKVGRSFPIDKDTFTAESVYVTPKQIAIAFTFHTKQKKDVWSFPAVSLKLVMPDGQALDSHDAGVNGTSWGSTGIVSFELPDKAANHATLVYDLYDRYGHVEIPLTKAGEGT